MLVVEVYDFDVLLAQRGRADRVGFKPKYLRKYRRALARVASKAQGVAAALPRAPGRGAAPGAGGIRSCSRRRRGRASRTRRRCPRVSSICPERRRSAGRGAGGTPGTAPRGLAGACFRSSRPAAVDRKRRVLTFPNFKFCTDYSVPGGSVDWDRVPRDLRT